MNSDRLSALALAAGGLYHGGQEIAALIFRDSLDCDLVMGLISVYVVAGRDREISLI